MTIQNYQELAHQLAEAQSLISEFKIGVGSCADNVELINQLLTKCLDHPNAKEHQVWRKGLLQAIIRLQKTLATLDEIDHEEE